MNDDIKGYCIFYADCNGNKDVTFFGPILSNMTSMSETEMVRLMFFNAHPTWTMLDMRACTFSEFRSIAKVYG